MKAALFLFLSVWPTIALADVNDPVVTALDRVAEQLDARVGFSAYDLETGQRWEYQANQRFPLSSTFKTLACADLLRRVDKGEMDSSSKVHFSAADLVTYSPVTEHFAGRQAMTLSALCEATLTLSDNTAANLILRALGGPASVTAFARFLGDGSTRLDRWETDLNEAQPGDPRDTTTPNAMVNNLHKLLLGDVLSVESRGQLRNWLERNQVADGLFRAAVPEAWVVADRTGAGGFGSRSITAVMWPPDRQPIIVALYITDTAASFSERNDAIADIGIAIVKTVSSGY
ncbi:class A beta-lactamase [Halopseudomonas salegens]|uniref:beta-lactamase n=1 Tax=Halopseudomonas salegens TaxID=1434072 RepID=A0A1H2HJ22_9GAMM|nr:beta-lactamase class A/beta-lactamase class A CARB-5 [Halopseudomonas salegens]